ncbi:MAG: hypothetical protein HJJLKODD_00200 [Phycisphaerae bacterium]|nr:hypothetical protein [Phycisphaerae bacterium]
MAALVEFSMSPLGQGESVSQYIARSLELIDRSGLDYRLNPMGTIVEGEWAEAFAVIQQCFEWMSVDCDRISCTIKVDWRRGHTGRLESKIKKVENILSRELKK